MNKYIVSFTLPISCSCIVEAENIDNAYCMISGKLVKEMKKISDDFTIDDDTIYDEDECSIIEVEEYHE